MTASAAPPLNSLRIDRTSPIPIYHQIVEGISRLILAGALPPGQRLPSETELSRDLGISPMTARQALNTLMEQGLIRRQRGVGSFVLARRLDRPLDRIVGFTEDMTRRGYIPTAQVLRFERVPPPPEVLERASFSEGATLLRIKRLRFANEQPVGIQDAYFAGVDFTREQLEADGSVYRLVADHGVLLVEGEEIIGAVAAQKEEARLLQIPINSPLLRASMFSWDQHGLLAEYTCSLFRADLYQFRARLPPR